MKPFKMRKPPHRDYKHRNVHSTFNTLDEFKDFLIKIAPSLYEGAGSITFNSRSMSGYYYDYTQYTKDLAEYRKWCEENKENIAKYKADADKRKAEKENIKNQRKLERLKKKLSDINN